MNTFKNKDRLERKFKALAKWSGQTRATVSKGMENAATVITNGQKALVPVQSGDLKNSIKFVKGAYKAENANVRGVGGGAKGDPDLTYNIVAGDAKAFYAAFVEFGTAAHIAGGKFKGAQHPGAKASPFFYPGYRATKKRAKARINKAIKQAVQDIVKGTI